MNAAMAERLMVGEAVRAEKAATNDLCIFDRIVEVDSPDDDTAFVAIDILMTLLVYLAPLAFFGYMVAPVAARLLSMPVTH
ncbi:MAG: hypothetical protein A4E67_00858 [Syntrophaceae bacterium PtaB.Bin038]|nr:MAG: hypothetical protein A4E67_00858 [Syntrophaceae bacterium PtaB.Bin038]